LVSRSRTRPQLIAVWFLLGVLSCSKSQEAVTAAVPVLLEERATAVGLSFTHENGAKGAFRFPEITGSGVAVFDADGDGDLDVYAVQSGDLGASIESVVGGPDQYFENQLVVGQPNTLKFRNRTQDVGTLGTGYGQGVAVGDVDRDGDLDVFVANVGLDELLLNDGRGRFNKARDAGVSGPPSWSSCAVFLDFDRDGWLDLFVCDYVNARDGYEKQCQNPSGGVEYCGPLAAAPTSDRLFRNLGDGRFEDVSRAAGISLAPSSALGVLARDFNGDGWVDLYVANDQRPNHLWLNSGKGTFKEEGYLVGVAVNSSGRPEASMGVDSADIDDDGDLDVFLTHLIGETNTLYVNQGTGVFQDRSTASGLGLPSHWTTGFGAGFVDADMNGTLDLLVLNGAVQRIEALVRKGDPFPYHESNALFLNRGLGRFEPAPSAVAPDLAASDVARAAAFGDLDNDGDEDIVTTSIRSPLKVFVNAATSARWHGVTLSREFHGEASCARASFVFADGARKTRSFSRDGSYFASSDPRAVVASDSAAVLVEVLLKRCDSEVLRFRAPPESRYSTLRRDEALRSDAPTDPGATP
ncbi:MAG: VCBS repeat-containing protein, partial [Myxococcota bacterium]